MADVTVLTPSYGYAEYLRDCLDSVRAQRGVSVQHVVQDGGSDDGTVAILGGYPDVDWRSEADRGQSDALNRALERARGRWIAWLNADEFYLPGALGSLVSAAEAREADLVYGETAMVDADGRFQRLMPQPHFSGRLLRDRGPYISTASLLIRREVLGSEPWDVDARAFMDWDLFLALAERGARGHRIKQAIGAFRAHDDRVTAAPQSEFEAEKAVVAARHGMPADHERRRREATLGRWGYKGAKIVQGAYLRQFRARTLRGVDLRWFRDDVDPTGAIKLQRRVAPGLSPSSVIP